MLNKIFIMLFKLAGWKLEGQIPASLKKSIVAVVPHASWVDFPVGLGARAVIGKKIGYLGKEELFKPPFGWLFKALGGTPVDRSRNNNLVEAVIQVFNKTTELHIALAPEGTRKNVEKLKSGFYYVAKGANIPIVLVGFDYPRKTVFVREPFYPTDNVEADFKEIATYFSQIQGVQKTWIQNYLEGKYL